MPTTHTLARRGAQRTVAVLLAVLALLFWSPRAAHAVVSSVADPTWMTNGRVTSVLVHGDLVYVGGQFTRMRAPNGTLTVVRNNAGAVNRFTGVVDDTWNPNANGEVAALATDGNVVFAGGTFTSIGGAANNRLAALHPATGTAVPGWRAGVNAKVYSLASSGGRLYAGGSFTSVNDGTGPRTASRLVAVATANGRVDAVWRPAANAYVRAVEMSADGSRVFVGGDFENISGMARRKIAAINAASGAVDGTFRADGQYLVFDLEATATAVYAATGGPGGRINSFNAVTGARNWTVNARGDVQAVSVAGNVVYGGGHFAGPGEFAGQERYRLAAVDTGGRLIGAFFPHPSGQVWALDSTPGTTGQPEKLYVGGDFARMDGRLQQGFAIFTQVV
jgi:hypothetical protein